jgi:hypothetical protein
LVLAVGYLLFGLVTTVLVGRLPAHRGLGRQLPPDDGRTGFPHPDVLWFVSGHAAGFSLGAKPATALQRDLGLTGQGEQAEPAGGPDRSAEAPPEY